MIAEAPGMSNRLRNCLANAGLTAHEAAMLTDEQILRSRHFGRKALRELRALTTQPPEAPMSDTSPVDAYRRDLADRLRWWRDHYAQLAEQAPEGPAADFLRGKVAGLEDAIEEVGR